MDVTTLRPICESVTRRRTSVTPPAAHGVTVRTQLVLSLFPGIDLLGRAFREAGCCVVTGPDPLFGGDIRDFAAADLAGRFDGIVAGPPCQDFSSSRRSSPTGNGVAMLREFLRVVTEMAPTWWLCENVPRVPDLRLDGYEVQRFDLSDVECGGVQLRMRHFQFGHKLGWICRPRRLQVTQTGAVKPAVTGRSAVLASQYGERSFREHCLRQGLPGSFRSGLRPRAAWWAVGNAVPLTMGRVVAQAVLAAGPCDIAADCRCGCGRLVGKTGRRDATPACRKRLERMRRAGGTHRRVVTWP